MGNTQHRAARPRGLARRYGEDVKIKQEISYTFAKPVRVDELDTQLMELNRPPGSITMTEYDSSHSAFGYFCPCFTPRFTYHVSIQGFSRRTRKNLLERAAGEHCQIKTNFDRKPVGMSAVEPLNLIKGGSCDALEWKGSSFMFQSSTLPEQIRMTCTFIVFAGENMSGATIIPLRELIGKKSPSKTVVFEWCKLVDVNSRDIKKPESFGAVKLRIKYLRRAMC